MQSDCSKVMCNWETAAVRHGPKALRRLVRVTSIVRLYMQCCFGHGARVIATAAACPLLIRLYLLATTAGDRPAIAVARSDAL